MPQVTNTKIIEHLYEPYIFNHLNVVDPDTYHQHSGKLVSKDYWDKDKYKVVLTIGAMNTRTPNWVSISSKEAGYGGAFIPKPSFSAFDNLVMSDKEMMVWMRFGLYLANIKVEFLNDLNYEHFTFYRKMLRTIKPYLRLRDSDFAKHYDLLW